MDQDVHTEKYCHWTKLEQEVLYNVLEVKQQCKSMYSKCEYIELMRVNYHYYYYYHHHYLLYPVMFKE